MCVIKSIIEDCFITQDIKSDKYKLKQDIPRSLNKFVFPAFYLNKKIGNRAKLKSLFQNSNVYEFGQHAGFAILSLGKPNNSF